jgi:hypothetical protein
MIVKGKRDFTTVNNGKIVVNVSELFHDGENVEVVVLEDCDQVNNKEETPKTIQMTLHIADEVYGHVKYLFENLKGITIIEDKYTEGTL